MTDNATIKLARFRSMPTSLGEDFGTPPTLLRGISAQSIVLDNPRERLGDRGETVAKGKCQRQVETDDDVEEISSPIRSDDSGSQSGFSRLHSFRYRAK